VTCWRRSGDAAGYPLFVRERGGRYDAVGIGVGRWGVILASRAARDDPAWPLLSAHLASHARRGDAAWFAAGVITTVAATVALAWVAIPSALLLALFAQHCERCADAAAARAAIRYPEAAPAFAEYIGADGNALRGAPMRIASAALRFLRLASHPSPARRRARFLAAIAAGAPS
jgi:hypothetical protein